VGYEGLPAPLPGARFVDPDIAHHRVHPAIQPRAFLPLAAIDQRPLDRRLAQVVAVGGAARQADGEAPQPRHQCEHAIFETFCQFCSLSWMKRTWRRVSSLLNAKTQELDR